MSNSYKIAVLPGDGIGPEVTAESVKVLNVLAQAFQYKFEFEYAGAVGLINLKSEYDEIFVVMNTLDSAAPQVPDRCIEKILQFC